MKKYLLGILILVVVEAVALALASYLTDTSTRGGGLNHGEGVYEVIDSTNYDASEPIRYSCLYNRETDKVVKTGIRKYNYECEMKINDEGKDYVLLVYDGHFNVYDRKGKAVFKEDREFHHDYDREAIIIKNGTLIADYNTGEYFDMKGNPVNTLSTKFDSLKHHHGDYVNIIIFMVFMLIAFLLWYFLFWRLYMRKQTLSKAVRNTHSILLLLLSLAVAIFIAAVVCMSFSLNYPIANNFTYKIVESNDGNGGKVLLYYNESTNSNDVIREGSSNMEKGLFPTTDYIIIKDGSKSNVYGPEGKAVFDEDLENAKLVFNGDGDIIFDSNTGDCYDMNGKPVNSMKATIYKNETAMQIITVVVCLLLASVLWFFLSWRRRNK